MSHRRPRHLSLSPTAGAGRSAWDRRSLWLGQLALGAGLLLPTACVVSTWRGVGEAPDLPEAPVPPTSPEAEAEPAGPESIGASHILIAWRGAQHASAGRSKDEAFQLASSLRQRALAGESFEELAKKNSDDRGSAKEGGKLGVFTRKQMVPSFSKAAFALEVGGISDVIESPYGYHVILRTE